MTLMTTAEFERFFEPYAPNVAGFSEAGFWRLSDALIKGLVRRHLAIGSASAVLDAGGGTGRWAAWLAEEFDCAVTVADKSESMLAEARRTVADLPVTLTRCDLQDAPDLPDQAFDAILSTYGVLSFLDDPAAAFRTLYRVARPGAAGLLMSHSLSTALASKINRDGGTPEEMRTLLETGIVKWSDHVPPLRVFTATELRELAVAAGFEVVGVYGVPCLTMPGREDFGYPYQKFSDISVALDDREYFACVVELELAAMERPEWTERGLNLMVHVRRPG